MKYIKYLIILFFILIPMSIFVGSDEINNNNPDNIINEVTQSVVTDGKTVTTRYSTPVFMEYKKDWIWKVDYYEPQQKNNDLSIVYNNGKDEHTVKFNFSLGGSGDERTFDDYQNQYGDLTFKIEFTKTIADWKYKITITGIPNDFITKDDFIKVCPMDNNEYYGHENWMRFDDFKMLFDDLIQNDFKVWYDKQCIYIGEFDKKIDHGVLILDPAIIYTTTSPLISRDGYIKNETDGNIVIYENASYLPIQKEGTLCSSGTVSPYCVSWVEFNLAGCGIPESIYDYDIIQANLSLYPSSANRILNITDMGRINISFFTVGTNATKSKLYKYIQNGTVEAFTNSTNGSSYNNFMLNSVGLARIQDENKVNKTIQYGFQHNGTVDASGWSIQGVGGSYPEILTIVYNNYPNTTQMVINSTPLGNWSNQTLVCYGKGIDIENETLVANYTWYKDSVRNYSGQTNINNGTLTNITSISKNDLTTNEIWTCSIKMSDGALNESDWNNLTVRILTGEEECGMKINRDYTMSSDLDCLNTAVDVIKENITLNCNYHKVTGNLTGYGISVNNVKYVTVENCDVINFSYNIFLYEANNSIVNNSKTSYAIQSGTHIKGGTDILINNLTSGNNKYGVGLAIGTSGNVAGSKNNTIKNSILRDNGYAIFVGGHQPPFGDENEDNYFINSTLLRNEHELSNAGEDTILKNITSLDNINTSKISTIHAIKSISNTGESVYFNFTMDYINKSACNDCILSYDIYPNQAVSNETSNNEVKINFTPTALGFHSVIARVKDTTNNNIAHRKISFYVNATGEYNATYYFSSKAPKNSIWYSYNANDIGSLQFQKIEGTETRTCQTWVQYQINDMHLYPLSYIDKANITVYYKGHNLYLGIGTYGYNVVKVIEKHIPNASNYAKGYVNFSYVNATVDYIWRNYYLSVKLEKKGLGNVPFLMSNATNQSTANLTFKYPRYPAIKSINGENFRDIRILSATMNATNSLNSTVELDGNAKINLSLIMPITLNVKYYNITMDDVSCGNNDNCNILNKTNTNDLNLELNLNSEHTLFIGGTRKPIGGDGGGGVSGEGMGRYEDYFDEFLSNKTFWDRFFSTDKNPGDGICQDGEFPILYEECNPTLNSLMCKDDCVFNYIWFARLLSILGIYLVFFRKDTHTIGYVLIGIFIFKYLLT